MKSLRHLILPFAGLLFTQGAHAEQFNVLVFSKTAGWHHDSINAGVTAIQDLGKQHNFDVFWTEDAERVINDKQLAKYKVVIFLLTSGDVLNDEQQGAFERFIKAGGGFVGVHSASDTEYGWPWYTKMLGHMFQTHPAIQTAVLKLEDRNFPGMDRFAKRSLVTEEWYRFGPALSNKLTYLLSVDEASYKRTPQPAGKPANGLGSFHPVSWYQDYDNGRAFYTALGHLPATYRDPVFLHHLYGGIYWAATGRTFKAD
ncbi:ThuA domain-containing protein [Massilia glaciei]|uniref:ThuA domain-containing protein n=2 Tax=Massilia glaciei TaxID=1524097 RepID=A0A2U2HIA0_9BURK|nr:ThuA domain-containing protein [Massilia glaciei]